MPIHAHRAGAVPAAGIVADEPRVVVGRREFANGVFDLRDQADCAEELAALQGRADDTVGSDLGERVAGEAEEREGVFAGWAAELQARTVFVADGVRQLGFQGCDVLELVGAVGA